MDRDKLKGHILILIANILFGISMPIFKYLLSLGVPPEAITIMRSAFACVMFWFISLFTTKEKVLPKDFGKLFIYALCGVGLNQLLFVIGLNSSSPVDASIIATASPILAALILKEQITVKKSIGVVMGVCGGLLLIFASAHSAGNGSNLKGDILMIVNYLMYSIYLVLSKPLSLHYSSITMMKWMFLFSTLALSPFCFKYLFDIPIFQRESCDFLELGALFYLLFGATFLAFMLIPMSLKRIRSTTVSMYNYVQPIIASLITIMIGLDTISWQKTLSAILVFVGVYLVTQSKSKNSLERGFQHLQ